MATPRVTEASTNQADTKVGSILDTRTLGTDIEAVPRRRDVDHASVGRRDDITSLHGDCRRVDDGHIDVPSTSSGEARQDPITGEWTLFAPARSLRPNQFGDASLQTATQDDCPFCVGRESQTPDAVWSIGADDDDPTWAVRVIPNLYPAVSISDAGDGCSVESKSRRDSSRQRSSRSQTAGSDVRNPLFVREPSLGGHEVFVESARHIRSLSELNVAEISLVFQAYAARMRHWRNVPNIRYVSIFKNVGRDAGASLQHGHSQLIASSRLPPFVESVTRRMQAHHARTGSCLQCDIVRAEIAARQRIVYQSDSLVAYCPYASRFPLLLRMTAREHQPNFEDSSPEMIDGISHLTLRAIRWLEAMRPNTAYNMILYSCPPAFRGDLDSQQWAIELFPRSTRIAGFELASGANINPLYPEQAAAMYRDQARQTDPRFVLH